MDPVDVSSMEDVFARLADDQSVQVQGVHWAALLNAYGCVQKDLDKAIEIFDSIPTHRSSIKSGLKLPDAVAYESMINVLISHRRMDLVPAYIARLRQSGVHMTAYIANLLIKGYAAAGDLPLAREVFESLLDPPIGVAAPNNHAPHENGSANVSSPESPVYREVCVLKKHSRFCLSDLSFSPPHGKPWFAQNSEVVIAKMQQLSWKECKEGEHAISFSCSSCSRGISGHSLPQSCSELAALCSTILLLPGLPSLKPPLRSRLPLLHFF